MVQLLAEQNASPSPAAASALEALGNGAGNGGDRQQVGCWRPAVYAFQGGHRIGARAPGHGNRPTACAIFWLAAEDHDFAEIDHVTFPGRKELHTLGVCLDCGSQPAHGGAARGRHFAGRIDHPRSSIRRGSCWVPLRPWKRWQRLIGRAARSRRRSGISTPRFSGAQGLVVVDASGRAWHLHGRAGLRAALERADELHAALLERNGQLEAAGLSRAGDRGSAVEPALSWWTDSSSARLGAESGLRPPRRAAGDCGKPAGRAIRDGSWWSFWTASRSAYSPSALFAAGFQDFLLSTSLTIGGPAEIAYFAQSAVLFERILGRATPVEPRLSATLIEPAIAGIAAQARADTGNGCWLGSSLGSVSGSGIAGAVAGGAGHAH